MFISPGDNILIDNPTYAGTLAIVSCFFLYFYWTTGCNAVLILAAETSWMQPLLCGQWSEWHDSRSSGGGLIQVESKRETQPCKFCASCALHDPKWRQSYWIIFDFWTQTTYIQVASEASALITVEWVSFPILLQLVFKTCFYIRLRKNMTSSSWKMIPIIFFNILRFVLYEWSYIFCLIGCCEMPEISIIPVHWCWWTCSEIWFSVKNIIIWVSYSAWEIIRIMTRDVISFHRIRVGWVSGPGPLVNRIELHMMASVMHTPMISQVGANPEMK
jgi:hypothetical protein